MQSDAGDSEYKEQTLKLPEPSSQLEKIRAALAERGVSPDQLQLLGLRKNENGDRILDLTVSETVLDAIIKAIGIKVFSPDNDLVKFGNVEAGIAYIGNEPHQPNQWRSTEQNRRRPKGKIERDPT